MFSINFSVAISEVRVEDCLCRDGDYDYDDINSTTNNSSYVKVTETSKLAALYLKLKLQQHIPLNVRSLSEMEMIEIANT